MPAFTADKLFKIEVIAMEMYALASNYTQTIAERKRLSNNPKRS